MQDVIQREITIKAPKERIYAAIADPGKVVKWFPETLEGQYEVGQQPVFGFGDHGKNQVYIAEARPHEYFAYRWVPGSQHFLGDVLSVVNTLVEFFISENPDQTCRVMLKESGFSQLPLELAENCFKQNSGGWEFMLGRLDTYFKDA